MTDTTSPVQRFYGKYRGTVVQNIDPELRGRIMCMVPVVLGLVPSSWCEPCAPLAGPTGPPMGVYMVPVIGAAATGFIYYVSREGVTGVRDQIAANIPEAVAAIKKHTALP